jgi:hypothetical protein
MYRVVKKFNQKVTYHFKNSPKKRSFLPSKVSITDIREKVYSRQDFNRIINRLDRFGRRGAEKIVTTKGGATVTKWELKEAKNLSRFANIKKAWRRKKLGISPQKGNVMSAEAIGLSPTVTEAVETKTERDLEKFIQSMERRLKADYYEQGYEQYKEHYLKGIKNQLGDKELIEMIEAIDPEELFEQTVANPKMRINFMYEPQEIQTLSTVMKQEVNRIWG